MIEIFSNNLSVAPDEDTSEVLVISGRGWENEPFKLYLRHEDAKNLIWQLSFYVSTQEEGI